MDSLSVCKFHGDRSTRLLVIAIFASVRKDEEKKNETLAARISEMA